MRLVELDPVFYVRVPSEYDKGMVLKHVRDAEGAQGVGFNDPTGSGRRVIVWFKNPIGVEPADSERCWSRSGSTAEDLSLDPSIVIPGWHGWVRAGEVVSAGGEPVAS